MPRLGPARIVLTLLTVGLLSLPAGHAAAGVINAGRGSVPVYVPASYDGTPMPVIVVLHGYSSNGASAAAYFQFHTAADSLGFIVLYPSGTLDTTGRRYWNATTACCDLYGAGGPDDSAYMKDLVDVLKTCYVVDPARIYFFGHSNGGFMSHRLACDHSDWIAGIASLAGVNWFDPANCMPAHPMHVVQIHGTNDSVIEYAGGTYSGNPYQGAVSTVEQWATDNGCTLATTALPSRDLVSNLAGTETTVTRYETGCGPGGTVELWTINGGTHSPLLSSTFSLQVAENLLAHPKPAVLGADNPPPARLLFTSSPNPFPGATRITYRADTPSRVNLTIFDTTGGRVRSLLRDHRAAEGEHVVSWDGTGDSGARLAAGVYFARIGINGTHAVRKLVLAR